ncbi:hypothetical protein MAR_026604 [Mya arenaria]|uniref:EF-hand domain-containing protein n=1 Tax=Mya arenaria TaxID=6604 RepID=A0ABY7EVI3_MYAAR|nr:hypothetical protein MAR_026604 [Mya arenaria]
MPKKKSGKKKKKSAKSLKEDKHANSPSPDPGTLVAADGTDGGISGLLNAESPDPKGKKKRKGKGKKKKLTKSEKDLMRAEKDPFHDFINTMDRWLVNNHKSIIRYFHKFDEDGEGILTYEDFKSGMLDMLCPCTNVQLHMLCKLLDHENTGDIDFTQFSKGLKYIRELEDLEREEEEADKILILSERTFEKCKCCKMSICGPYQVKYPKYIDLDLRLVTFNDIKKHPGHIFVRVHSHIPVSSLQELIVEMTGIMSTKLSIFFDKSRSREAMLPLEQTLQDLGFEGDTYDDPEELTLYYDYKVEFIDCPLLLCDYYFGQKIEPNIGKMVIG